MTMTMIATDFSAWWTAIAPGLGNHVWQSTVFALAAALLTLLLRRNHARARYWLWMAASVKFLIPFSGLIAIGSRLSWLCASAEANTGMSVVIEQVSQPFSGSHLSPILQSSPVISAPWTHLLPSLLPVLWLCGFAGVVLMWCMRWRHISVAVQESVPLAEGREVDALRRVERVADVRHAVTILLSRTTLEPGMFGWFQPVLLWPEGISGYLEDAHLEAILVHELWHVRRRDNLAAAIHMLVEAIFWFHPLVWWMGARLVEERERACDEQVLELGSQRQVYAESILKVCEFCVGSRLACVSGVTGADLKKRMVYIMSEQILQKLDFSRKLLLGAAASMAIAAPILFGLVSVSATPSRAQSTAEDTTTPAIQSFSIKPSTATAQTGTHPNGQNHRFGMSYSPTEFVASNVTISTLIQEAYGVQANQMVGGPDWLSTALYNVDLKVDKSEAGEFGLRSNKQASQPILQAALASATKLTVHNETKELPIYSLVVAENGPKLQPSQPAVGEARTGPNGQATAGKSIFHTQIDDAGQAMGMALQGVSTAGLAELLSRQLGLVVVDKTGLKGNYDFNLHWTKGVGQQSEGRDSGAAPDASSDASTGPSLFSAIQDQLGLKLEAQRAPVKVLVIDHIEKPAEN